MTPITTDDYKVKVFYKYRTGLLSKLRRIVPTMEEDAFNEGVINALRFWDSCKNESQRESWFFTVAIMAGLDMRRKLKHRQWFDNLTMDHEDFVEPKLENRIEHRLIAQQLMEIGTHGMSDLLVPYVYQLLNQPPRRGKNGDHDPLSNGEKIRRFRTVKHIKSRLAKHMAA